MQSIKVIELNTLPLTRHKFKHLDEFEKEYLNVLNTTFKFLTFCLPDSNSELHSISYTMFREETNLPSQIIETARREVWSKRKNMFDVSSFKKASIRMTERDYKFDRTIRHNPIFAVKLFKNIKKIVIPIKQDGSFKRFNELIEGNWNFKSIILVKRKNWKIQVVFKKEFPDPKQSRIVVGVDVGSATLSAVTVYDSVRDKIIKQLYFGRDIADKQRKYIFRRARLSSYIDKGDFKAKRYLKNMSRRQSNFVKTRSYQVAWQIIRLAKEYNACIAIENLNIRSRKGQMRKKSNRIINRIPYFRLFWALETIAIRESIFVSKVSPRHTSKTCYKCGAIGERRNALFKCINCGHTCNADRNASVNIAKSLIERNNQSSINRVAVNQPVFSDDVSMEVAVQHNYQLWKAPCVSWK